MKTTFLILKIKTLLFLLVLLSINNSNAQKCEYSIALYDQFDNSWNGGSVEVFLDGENVLDVSMSGFGDVTPVIYNFEVADNAEITTLFTAGIWPEENTYEIIDFNGDVIYTDGAGYQIPQGIPAGILTAACPQTGYLKGKVYDYNGNIVNNVNITTETGRTTKTSGGGDYFLKYIPEGLQDITASKSGYNSKTHSKFILSGDTAVQIFTLTIPEISIQTLELIDTLRFGEYLEKSLQLSNEGSGPVQWQAEVEYETADLFKLNVNQEIGTSSGLTGLTGAESNGNHVFVTQWNSNQIAKFTVNGNFVEIFEIPFLSGLRDLAYDGNYFYGGNAAYQIYILDFQNHVIVDSIASPVKVRGIAYDEQLDAFWVCGFEPEVVLIDRNAEVLQKISGLEEAYGLAWDFYSSAGPYLWLFTGTTAGSTCELRQIDIAAADFTGLKYNVSADMGRGLAGGLYIEHDYYNRINLSGIFVSDSVNLFGYELHSWERDNWLELLKEEGELSAFGGTGELIIAFNSSDWAYVHSRDARIRISTNPDLGENIVNVRLQVEGDSLIIPANLQAELTDPNAGNVSLNWTHVGSAPYFEHYMLIRNGIELAITQNNYYVDDLSNHGEYTYEVKAYYQDGISSPSAPAFINWNLPQIDLQSDFISVQVLENETEISRQLSIANNGNPGSLLSFNIEYDDPVGFIKSIDPMGGVLQKDEFRNIKIVYDANDLQAGAYFEDLLINSNDQLQPQRVVRNQLKVSEAAVFTGQVSDISNGVPMQGVSVTAGEKSTETDEDGVYQLKVFEGTYNLKFELPAYDTLIINQQFVQSGEIKNIDAELYEEAYKPQFIEATTDTNENICLLEWGAPSGSYLALYDNGIAGNFFAWEHPGSINAVKFTPAGYPAKITGGEVYIGNGSFPENAQILGTNFGVVVYDDDAAGGMPGTLLDSIAITVDTFGWISFDGLGALIPEGDFYLGIMQNTYFPNTAGVGIENDPPLAYRSYQKPYNGGWIVSSFQDFMIRALLEGPRDSLTDKSLQKIVPDYEYKIQARYVTAVKTKKVSPGREMLPDFKTHNKEDSQRKVENYFVTRFSDFNPEDPNDLGTAELIASEIEINQYTDAAFGSLSNGYYKYGVTSVFPGGNFSDTTVSNTVGRAMNFKLEIQLSTSDSLSPEDARIELAGREWPYAIYRDTAPASGNVIIEDVYCGTYILKLMKPGYHIYRDSSLYVCSGQNLNIELQEGIWNVEDLYVDPLTSLATWSEPPAGLLLYEDFEEEMFPPEAWNAETSSYYGPGWFRTRDGSGGGWNLPPGDGYYACVNDALNCSAMTNSCCDYLVTPPLGISSYENYLLVYDTYFENTHGGTATVEYSEDGGVIWKQLYKLETSWPWREEIVDLSPWSGMAASENLVLRFHYNDHGGCTGGWAVDNVKVAPASSRIFRDQNELIGYELYLDSNYAANTQDTFYFYSGLVYGQTYEAAVAALYSSGSTEKDRYVFTSEFLIPPGDLVVETIIDTAFLSWEAPQDSTGIPAHLLGYNIYRDHFDEGADSLVFIDDPQQTSWLEAGLEPMSYAYAVTAVYDLEIYGFPGQTDESAMAGPEDCLITYGHDLPFTEDWQEGSFANQQWESSCDAWQINQSSGNGAPSAEFHTPDTLQDYECSIVTYPLKGSVFTEGIVYLEFDLKLDDLNMTEEEHFIVRIKENDQWNDVWQMSNNGDMDWTTFTVDISDEALGNDFRIGFFTTGMNSTDIYSWFLDNINVYHICPAPFDLNLEQEELIVYLNWQSPDTVAPVTEWLHYDDNVNFIGIGYDGPADFDVAARWEPSQLVDYDGTMLTKVNFFPNEVQCEYSIRVWTGANAANMLVDQLVEGPVIDAWNTVALDAPVEVDASQELWIGYRNKAQAGFPAGVDPGPAVAGYGDMIYDAATGWVSMATEYGLDYNWNIQGYVTSETDGVVALTPIEDQNRKANAGSPEAARPVVQTEASVFTTTNHAFVGYNIYRQHNNMGEWIQVNEDLVTETSYTDVTPENGLYCYYIESVFEGCVSDSSNNQCVIISVGIADVNADGLVIYPNPTRDLINIASLQQIERVTVLNYLGQVVKDQSVNDAKELKIGMENIEDGLYFIRIETTGGTVIRKITIAR